jgi:hypothetical protein
MALRLRSGCWFDEQKRDDVRQRFWAVTMLDAGWQHGNVAGFHRYGRVIEPDR